MRKAYNASRALQQDSFMLHGDRLLAAGVPSMVVVAVAESLLQRLKSGARRDCTQTKRLKWRPEITVNGVVNEIAREKPRLRPNAVPTVLENYPAHFVPKKAVTRTVRNLCDQGPAPKQRKRNVELADAVLCSAVDNGETRVGSHWVSHGGASEGL
ncbi:hypothetical protein HPB50_026409 [Hyalomma asiaticum]|uniref:Uncharacterized protein n=1 Tax=Hyalomma asiaticum TaxID=266040 RepID=A0ACB7T1X4_HYAAI|nr:hypothetical protein HPB50_026409 [Hyalomma asiaticum]